MRTTTHVLTAAALLSIGIDARPVRATVIDFDDVPGIGERPIARDRYLAQGVYFPPPIDQAVVNGPSTSTDTPPNWLQGPHVWIEFMVPGTTTPGVTDSISFYITFQGDPQGVQPAHVALGGLGALGQSPLFEERFVPPTDGLLVSFTRATSDVHWLVFEGWWDTASGVDTLTFGEIVPDPGTLAVLGVGILAAARSRR
jgi:hypothetical protein